MGCTVTQMFKSPGHRHLLGIFRDVRHLIDCGSPEKEEEETAKADAIGDTWGITISWPGIAAPWGIPISWHIPVKDKGDRNVAGNGSIATALQPPGTFQSLGTLLRQMQFGWTLHP